MSSYPPNSSTNGNSGKPNWLQLVSTTRALPKYREEVSNIELHCFGDASRCGVFPAVYAVVSQPSGNGVGLVAAKATLAKQGLTIRRLDLVSGHMAMNIILNVP